MKCYCYPTRQGLLQPCSDIDMQLIKTLKQYKPIEVEVIKRRNLKFHRKFFALLNALMDIEEIEAQFENIEKLRWALTISAGYFEEVPGFKGQVTFKPKSISFAKMDGAKFDEFYAKIMALVLARLPNYCEVDIEKMTNEVLTFA